MLKYYFLNQIYNNKEALEYETINHLTLINITTYIYHR